jgi:HPt (histidine-containing phosphotransfer) domain-containing protein
MDEFLPKPISSTALAAALARALERRPPPAIAPAAAAIDAEAIARLDSDLGDRAELRRIAGIYLAQLGPGTRAIAAAVATHDGEALHAAAHRLGSPSATFGAGGVAELCQRLEALGAAGSTSGAEELVRALEGECARAVAQLRRLLELR